jgi:hypothetical protein
VQAARHTIKRHELKRHELKRHKRACVQNRSTFQQ